MFNLSRYFSTVSFILIVLAAGVLGPLYQKLSLQQMQDLAEGRNLAMAQVFQNSLRDSLDSLMSDSVGQNPEFLEGSEGVRRLQAKVLSLMHDTAIVKIKIYNRLGNTVFTSDTGKVGESRLGNPGFRSAITGAISSNLTHRDSIDSFEGTLAEVDILASYIPIRGKDQSVEGVFELYQNVTPFVTQLNQNMWMVTGGVALVFASLYLMQFLVVRRAQGILEDQEGRIASARDTLEIQVEARTDELKRTNTQLEGEISERRQAQSKLNYLAYHDPLTGLSNRRSFIERLEESLRESARRDEQLAVLFIDLDQFKQVNDSLGHGVGDELLIAVAARLSEHVRLIDMLARLGGDEFICLMEGVRSEDDVEILAREVIGAFELPFVLGDHELFLTASVGICLSPSDGDSVLDLMRNADTAMYRAKALGRGNFHFYTPEMTRDAQSASGWKTCCGGRWITANSRCICSRRSKPGAAVWLAPKHWFAGTARNWGWSCRCVSFRWPRIQG